MSVIKVNNITNRDGTSGPVIAGITTVSSTSHMVVPSGSTGQRVALAPDPFINNLVLALPFNSESVFSDISPRNNQPMSTGIGTTTASLPFGVSGVTSTSSGIQTSIFKYYGSSAYFDGNFDYLTVSASSDLNFGTGDFTAEFWIYSNPANSSAYRRWLTTTNGAFGSNTWVIREDGSSDKSIGANSGRLTSSNAFQRGQWNHIAYVKYSGVESLYVNGINVANTTATYNYTEGGTNGLYIGGFYNPSSEYFDGYLQDLRIYKGVAKYTSNFTPPTQIAL